MPSLHCVCALLVQGKVVVESGLVMKVRKNGAIVFIPRFGIEGIVYVTSRKQEKEARVAFIFDEVAQRLTSVDTPSNTLRVFDEVCVFPWACCFRV
jgi:exoribonuclease R